MMITISLMNVLILFVVANPNNDLIVDYFIDKNVPFVVGYSCNSMKDDLVLWRRLNRIGIAVALDKLNVKLRINSLAATNYWKLGIFLDIRCYDLTNIVLAFSEATNYRMFDELRYWLIISSDLSYALEIINDEAFGVSTNFMIAIPSDEKENYFHLFDVYNVYKKRGGELNITLLGFWEEDKGLNIFLNQTKLHRRSNFNGINFKVVFFQLAYKNDNRSLEEYLTDYTQSPKDNLSRFGFLLLLHLSELFNFSLLPIETPKWEPGDKIGPLIQALRGNDSDFAGSPLTMSIPRSYWVKFIHSSWPFRTCFIFRNPQPTDIKVDEIFRPFADVIWYLLLLMLPMIMTVVTFVSQLDWKESNWMRFSNSFILTSGAICQQCTNISMKYLSTRIAFFSIMVFGLLIYDYYSACVVSARLNEPIVKIDDSLLELAKLDMKIASERMVYLDFFLRRADKEAQIFLERKWLPIPETNRYMEPEEAMRLVREGGFAYHTHPDVGYPFIDRYYDNRETCELTEVHLVRPTLTAFAVNFNSTIVELLRVGLTKISEVGLRNRQVQKWHYRRPICQKNILSASSVNMYEFAPHLLLLMFGMLIAIGVNIAENMIVKRKFYREKFKLCARRLSIAMKKRIRLRRNK